MEQAKLMSSVMGQVGNRFRSSLGFVDSILHGCLGTIKAGEWLSQDNGNVLAIISDATIMNPIENFSKYVTCEENAQGFLDKIKDDIMFMVETVKYTPLPKPEEQIAMTHEEFWASIENCTKTVCDDWKAVVGVLSKEFNKSLQAIFDKCPNLELPNNFLSVKEIQEVLALEKEITGTFDLKRSKVVSESAASASEMLDVVKHASGKLCLGCDQLCDHGNYLQKYHSCLTWMWLATELLFNFNCVI